MHRPGHRTKTHLESIHQEQILRQLELEQLQINRIQQQRETILKIHSTLQKKDRQIERLSSLVQRYQPSYQQQAELRIELAEKDSTNRSLMTENQFLRKGFKELMEQCQELNEKMRQMERERQNLIRERHCIERMHREIQETFREYKEQCKARQEELEKENQLIKDTNESLFRQIEELKTSKPSSATELEEAAALKTEIKRLQLELSDREAQLLKNRKLNHELSIEFDRSVNKIVQFEHELKEYRRDNHELKKTLGLVLQQQKYQKLRNKYMSGSRKENVNVEEQQSLEEEDSSEQRYNGGETSPQLSSIKY